MLSTPPAQPTPASPRRKSPTLTVVAFAIVGATFALGALSGGVYVKLSGKIFNDGVKSRRSGRLTAADFANFSGIRYYDERYLEQEPYFAEVKRANSLRNLAAISVAMARYAQAHDGCWPPPYSTDADGKPLHSWRVLILPYFERGAYLEPLYEQIRLDEPWDSEWNRRFHDKTPPVYYSPTYSELSVGRDRTSSETFYAVFVGDETLYTSQGVGVSWANGRGAQTNEEKRFLRVPLSEPGLFRDDKLDPIGLATLAVVERNESVCWMRPDAEIPFDEVKSGEFLRAQRSAPRHRDRDGGFYLLGAEYQDPIADVSATGWLQPVALNDSLTQEYLTALATWNGKDDGAIFHDPKEKTLRHCRTITFD